MAYIEYGFVEMILETVRVSINIYPERTDLNNFIKSTKFEWVGIDKDNYIEQLKQFGIITYETTPEGEVPMFRPTPEGFYLADDYRRFLEAFAGKYYIEGE